MHVYLMANPALADSGTDRTHTGHTQEQEVPFILEAYPDGLQARRELQERQLLSIASRASDRSLSPQLVVQTSRLWRPGGTIRVAFNGGTPELHRRIEQSAIIWAQYGNIRFDFGRDTNGSYRSWSTDDTGYVAEIRIAFDDGVEGGYWSVIGTESVDRNIATPGQSSMNLGGFEHGWPIDGEETVLHEFGHALGLHHEHQHPTQGCDSEFRWYDDTGYILTVGADGGYTKDEQDRWPGVYTMLSGYPNYWPTSKVNFNLKQFVNSSAYEFGNFDDKSIMIYRFYPSMFRTGIDSYCYSAGTGALSLEDRKRIAMVYPKSTENLSLRDTQRQKAWDILREGTGDGYSRASVDAIFEASQSK